jgi:hypothetical protein
MAAGKTYEPIATTTLGSAQTQITFSSIPSTYTDLVLVSNLSIVGYVASMYLRFNNDGTATYSNTRLYGDGSSAASDRPSTPQTEMYVGIVGAGSAPESVVITNIQNYANATTKKTVLSRGNSPANYVSAIVGLWSSTAAINRIDIYFRLVGTDTAAAGSTFTLYGISAA